MRKTIWTVLGAIGALNLSACSVEDIEIDPARTPVLPEGSTCAAGQITARTSDGWECVDRPRDGVDGMKGDTGEQGPQGPTGPTGPKGGAAKAALARPQSAALPRGSAKSAPATAT